ncbi:MAG: hypothetical protein ACTHLO_02365 [Pseudolabrys sp.]
MAADRAYPDQLEPDSTRPKLLLMIAGAVLLLLAVAFGAVYAFYAAEVPPHGPMVPKGFPSPRLMQDETDWLRRAQTEQQSRLEGWRWVDRDKGVIAMPIEDAMRRIAARGAQGYSPVDSAPQGSGQ